MCFVLCFSARVNTETEPVDDANFSAVNAILEEVQRDYQKNLTTTEDIANTSTQEDHRPQEAQTSTRTSLNQAETSSPRTTTPPEVSTTSRGI